MIEFLKKISMQWTNFFSKLTVGRRIALIFTGIVVMISFVSLFIWTGETSYQILGTNFTTEDATAIMRFLRERKIPFKVENDGKTIKIPPETIYDLRLELATMGLPQTGIVGYEIFDQQSFSTTSYVQRINQKRALEGELMRTINNLKGVKRSRIHLALPNKSAFIEDQKKATASVVLDLEHGVELSNKQVLGITRLIATAVEGMETSDVTILDGNGKLLSKGSSDPLSIQSAAMIDMQQKLEGEYEKRIEDILSRVVGEGKVVAKVSAELDFTQQVETSKQYDAEGSAVKSQQKETQVMDGSRPIALGQPGAASNTPGGEVQSPAVRSNTQKSFDTTNYAVPEKVIQSTKPIGQVKKLSVAVLIDGLYVKPEGKEGAADAPPVFQKWNEEKINEFKAIVSSAVGLDLKRGDILEIKNIEFRREELNNADAQIAAYERKKMLMNIVQYAVIGLAIALFFMFVVRPFIKWLTDNTVENMESFLPKTIEELEKMESVEEDLEQIEEAIPVIVDKVDPEKIEGEMIKEKVITLVESNPVKAAMILHEWVSKVSNNAAREANQAIEKKG